MNIKTLTRNRRMWGVLLAASLLGTVMASTALAHTHVAESDPADGSVVDKVPAQVMVRFGNESFPTAQPGQIQDARLEVFDACGNQVDKKDSSVNMQESRVTVSSGGAVAGRYEIHWYATAADGAEQQGVLDFIVKGTPCKKVTRVDPADDVDLGFELVSVGSVRTRRGARLRVVMDEAIKCSDLTDKQTLGLRFDTNGDDTTDVEGDFRCKRGSFVLKLKSKDEVTGTLAANQPTPGVLEVNVTRHVLLGHVDFHAEASLDAQECDEKTCFDRAPDLGSVRAF